MNRAEKIGRVALVIVVLAIAAQVGASLLLKTKRMRSYLTAHLEQAFGRPVEVKEFSVKIVPMPRIDAEGVTIGEDPSFGREYFLRAEHMTASLRWMGLLRGQFEFGTMSLTRSSLILVRNAEGRWNLEGWLPPAANDGGGARNGYGPQKPAKTTHLLQKIEFDEGRINFKIGDEKRPFAFTGVSGSVEQVSAGRWQLRLEAQPWRSGVPLQSTGTLQVRGDLAGTTARLQPAQVSVHWDKVSVADLFRMVTGNDPGVRGEFALDGTASVGEASAGTAAINGLWKFEMHARTSRVHRWDLTERADNPRANLNLKGEWNLGAGEVRATEMKVELPHSKMEGTGSLSTKGEPAFRVEMGSIGVRAEDVLGWYRAFQGGVAEGILAEQFFSGRAVVAGWPLRIEDAGISSTGGELRVPGIETPVRIGAVNGTMGRGLFSMAPVRVSLRPNKAATAAGNAPKNARSSVRQTATGATELQNAAEIRFWGDLKTQSAAVRVDSNVEHSEELLKIAAAFGHTMNRGWEYEGGESSAMEWGWKRGAGRGKWNGSVGLSKGVLQIAGLNQPVKLEDVSLSWNDGRRAASLTRAEAFGATWYGTIEEQVALGPGEEASWQFQLHADQLDAANLDRWFGPRARPNWVQRLLISLRGNAENGTKANELLRRIAAKGEITADELVIEKLKLTQAKASVALKDLKMEARGVEAQWSGGTIRGEMEANFAPRPQYEIAAEFEKVELGQLPWSARWAERWKGTASGELKLATAGIGRDELLKQLEGRGELQLKSAELRGWDTAGSLESGAVKPGSSQWSKGAGNFTVKDRAVNFEEIRLEGSAGKAALSVTAGFGQEMKLSFAPVGGEKRNGKSVSAKRMTIASDGTKALEAKMDAGSAVPPKL